MVTAANRGKWAETQVKKKLNALEAKNFCHHRFPDARAGSLQATLADFMYVHNGKMCLLEVKEVNTSYRLPYANLKLEQISKMRMWKMAGAQAHVLIYHTPDKVWRVGDIAWFFLGYRKTDEAGKSLGSWDLRTLEPITLDDYFETFA